MWPLSSDECYVSIDIEADGPVPGLHSMLSLGAAAFTSEGVLGDTFSVNLESAPRDERGYAHHAVVGFAAGPLGRRAGPTPRRRSPRCVAFTSGSNVSMTP